MSVKNDVDKVPDEVCVKIGLLPCIFMCYCCAHSKTTTQSKSEARKCFLWSSLRLGGFDFLWQSVFGDSRYQQYIFNS